VTRATLLHVLDRPTALGPAEVRELEQLAQAFPYCQTAHLLLAKAAHDQGTMLAGQRLRRAATYAADRTLLRRLIEMVEPAPAVEAEQEPAPIQVPPAVVEAPVAVEAPIAVIAPPLPEPVALVVPTPEPPAAEPALPAAPVLEAPEPQPAPVPVAEPVPVVVAQVTPEALAPAPAPILPASAAPEPAAYEQAIAAAPSETIPALPVAAPAPAPAQAPEIPVNDIAPEPLPTLAAVPEVAVNTPAPAAIPETPQPQAPELPELVDQEGAALPTIAPTADAGLAEASYPEPLVEEADLPAVAPAIRPPVEVGEARFEFGLAEAAPPVVPAYELPGLVDEWAASAVTRSLGSPDALLPGAVEPPTPAFTPAAFTGDAVVGYAFGESSRLGLSMQLLDMLAAQAEAAEAATAVVAAAQPPAVALPPTGTFFEPDPLLLDHWATHCPPPLALPSSLDLINNFLKRQPRLTRPAMLPPTTGGQADLSARSTRPEPDLVSENLARIFVRQGKNARAIEIYEKLMVKHPEKLAYFALQIQSLQPSA
jgi:hypothetical protein